MIKRFGILLIIVSFFCCSGYAEEAFIYNPQGMRDPFVPLVGITTLKAKPAKPKVIESLADVTSIEEVKLQGIAHDALNRRIAILNNEIIRESETIGHLTVKKVSENEITLIIDEKEYMLKIYE